jgi:hypothetical protein
LPVEKWLVNPLLILSAPSWLSRYDASFNPLISPVTWFFKYFKRKSNLSPSAEPKLKAILYRQR